MDDPTPHALPHDQLAQSELRTLAAYFLKLGFTAFGGPAAHIALMHNEVVKRRHWLDEQTFLDLLGAANLIPGPTSTELAIFIGYRRAGWRGLVLGGVCFILPAMLIVMALAWAYVRFGSTTEVRSLLYGVLPVVIVIIVQAAWSLGRKAITSALTAVLGITVIVLYLLGINILVLLIAAGLVVLIAKNSGKAAADAALVFPLSLASRTLLAALVPFSLPLLFFTFFKIGAVLYGSGYVLLAFLHDDFVKNLGWLTEQQLLDAVAVGQVTPGPVFTTATFIGYLLGGVPGALIATLGIFLPSFFFVAFSSQIIPRLRNSKWTASILDGVNVASLGLMIGVTFQLAQTAFIDPLTIAIALVTAFLLFRFHLNSTWLIAGGAAVGLVRALVFH